MSKFIKNIGFYVEQFFEFVIGSIIVIFFSGVAIISFVLPVLGIIILAWEWNFIGEKTFKVSEDINLEGQIFQKMTEISFSPDISNQIIFVELKTPTPEFVEKTIVLERVKEINIPYVWSKLTNIFFSSQQDLIDIGFVELEYKMGLRDTNALTEAEKKLLVEQEKIQKFKTLIKPTILDRHERLIALKDCVVASDKNWMCQGSIPFLKGASSYFGMSDGNYVHDYLSPQEKYYRYKEYAWKTSWMLEKRHCNEICFLETVQQREEQLACAEQFLENLMKKMNGNKRWS